MTGTAILDRHGRRLFAGVLLLLLVTPPLRSWWELSMVRHMLVQIPLLVVAGALLAPRAGGRGCTADAITALLVASFCLSFWMIPRWLDAAATHGLADSAKIVSLLLLAGLPIGWGWRRAGAIARAFVWVQLIGMLLTLGLLYQSFPGRLCNNYLFDEQVVTGWLMLVAAGGLGLWLAGRALFGGATWPERGPESRPETE